MLQSKSHSNDTLNIKKFQLKIPDITDYRYQKPLHSAIDGPPPRNFMVVALLAPFDWGMNESEATAQMSIINEEDKIAKSVADMTFDLSSDKVRRLEASFDPKKVFTSEQLRNGLNLRVQVRNLTAHGYPLAIRGLELRAKAEP